LQFLPLSQLICLVLSSLSASTHNAITHVDLNLPLYCLSKQILLMVCIIRREKEPRPIALRSYVYKINLLAPAGGLRYDCDDL
jgi:hypothetical protein